jgi:hypothetical protein
MSHTLHNVCLMRQNNIYGMPTIPGVERDKPYREFLEYPTLPLKFLLDLW